MHANQNDFTQLILQMEIPSITKIVMLPCIDGVHHLLLFTFCMLFREKFWVSWLCENYVALDLFVFTLLKYLIKCSLKTQRCTFRRNRSYG